MSVKTLSTKWPGLGLSVKDFFEPWNDWFLDGGFKTLTIPHVNVSEVEDSYTLSLAVPGMTKKDFIIDVEGNMLTISAEKEENKEEKEKSYARREYNYSSFSRSFTLPEEVVQNKIEASYQDGILKIILPKNEKEAKKIHKAIAVN